MALYAASIPLAYLIPVASYAVFVAVAILWLVPDRRIEREIERDAVHRPTGE